MEIPDQFRICETQHWLINHRIDSALPGYLMVSSIASAADFSELSDPALASLGPVLANAEQTLKRILLPVRVYVGRFGHSAGYSIHFHLIPIYQWVEKQFWEDSRYRALEIFGESQDGMVTDGAELTFFVWREFCERPDPPPIEGPSITQVVSMLRDEIR